MTGTSSESVSTSRPTKRSSTSSPSTVARQSYPSPSPRGYRLWLNNEFFVDLDEEGHCFDCIEGAMGYVLRCSSSQRETTHVAWKLPRMIADTQRENAYIAQLLEGERGSVRRIGNRAQQLIRNLGVDNPLEFCSIGVRPAADDPNTWAADQRVLVRFHKGKRPRFCSVQVSAEGELVVTPPGALQLVRDEWDRLARFLSADAHGAGRFAPAFLADAPPVEGQSKGAYTNVEPWPLSQVVDRETPRSGWYIGLPTIVYDWAGGTLQDVISNRRRRDWTIVHHFALVERVLAGITTLHRNGMLHGDIRPANIMFTDAPNEPDNYIVTDYGSLASGSTNIVGGDVPADRTVLHAIANARASSFYAPERRQAFEHEDGDCAIIAADPGDPEAFIVAIGWRSRLDDLQATERTPPTGPVEALVRRCVEGLERSRSAGHERHARLCPGDRVRLRDYVFELVEAPQLLVDGFAVIRCRSSASKVCNERLVVPLGDFWAEFSRRPDLPERTVMLALPKVVEIYQWSQATDLFSIGVLLLYSFHGQGQDESSCVEREFTELLETLANPLYFSRMWPHVDRVCNAIETIAREHPGISASDFRNLPSGIDLTAMNRDLRDGAPSSNEVDTVYRAALGIVQHITQTAPHARKLATSGFGGNVAEFLLVIHYAFSCLHRKIDLLKYDALRTSGDSNLPFCDDRTSRDHRATERALQQARHLRELFTRGTFREMRADTELPDYRPVSAAELILQNTRLENEGKALAAERDRIAAEGRRVVAERDRLAAERDRLERESTRLRKDLLDESAAHQRVAQELEASTVDQGRLQAQLTAVQRNATALKGLLDGLSARFVDFLGWRFMKPYRRQGGRAALPPSAAQV